MQRNKNASPHFPIFNDWRFLTNQLHQQLTYSIKQILSIAQTIAYMQVTNIF